MGKKKGVLLLNLGGPDSPEAVRPFLVNLFSDRDIIRLGPSPLQKPLAWTIASARAGKTRANYSLIGGASPLRRITEAQGRALEAELKGEYSVFVGMRYWHPFIKEALAKALSAGVEELLVLPLYPQYSKATTGSCFKDLEQVLKESRKDIKVSYVKSFHRHPQYIRALTETIKTGLKRLPELELGSVHLLFSAHGLPENFVKEGDPYVDQIKETIKVVLDEIGDIDWHLAFQSRSGPVKWIGPGTDQKIRELSTSGAENVLMVPVSFVSDHIETLYEMDILYKGLAESLGLGFGRAPSLNTSPGFIKALADIVTSSFLNG